MKYNNWKIRESIVALNGARWSQKEDKQSKNISFEQKRRKSDNYYWLKKKKKIRVPFN